MAFSDFAELVSAIERQFRESLSVLWGKDGKEQGQRHCLKY